MISYERELEIRYKAIFLLENCKINVRKPILVKDIIKNCEHKIMLINRRLDGVLGFSCYHEQTDSYLVVTDIEENKLFRRYRFTLAHEIGHIELGHLKDICPSSMKFENRILEREASVFAEELLMPTTRCMIHNLDTSEKISQYYNVSKEAADIKFKNLKDNAVYNEYLDSQLYYMIRSEKL